MGPLSGLKYPFRGRVRRLVAMLTVGAFTASATLGVSALFMGDVVSAQAAPGGGQAPARGAAAPAGRGTGRGAAAAHVDANLLQLMRGVLYPASNVIFAAQDDITKLPQPADPSVSPNPLTSTYGGWTAVENAALAIAESANLIALPGRMCSNGKPAPVQRADWLKYTEGVRVAGLAVYKAAQTKSSDAIVDVAGTLSDACAACHDVYREKKTGPQDRCLP
jgi:hypothetical protein